MKLILDENLKYVKENVDGDGYTIDESGKCVVYQNNVEIMDEHKKLLKMCEFTPLVTNMKSCAFEGCENLMVVKLNNVDCISESAFEYCGLRIVELPNVTNIEDNAFYYCRNLTDIDLSNVTSIGDYAFYYCNNLRSVKTSKFLSVGRYAFWGCENLTNIDLSNVESIGFGAFWGCRNLQKVYIPNVMNIADLGEFAFNACPKLKTITVGSEKIAKPLRKEYPDVNVVIE